MGWLRRWDRRLGVPLGLLYANAIEWGTHKYILHGWGKKRASFWSFHWHDHHRNVRRNEHYDEGYRQHLLGWHSQSKEVLALAGIGVVHAPLFAVTPVLGSTLFYCLVRYYVVHRRAHLDPDWARDHLPWHYDHHMGPNQDANWCVTWPWFDHLMGTREYYHGTARARQDRVKRAALAAKRAARAAAREAGDDVASQPSV